MSELELKQDLASGAVRVWVPGRARTKGSLKPTHVRLGAGRCKAGLREDGEFSVAWKNTMIAAIRAAAVCERWPDPVAVHLLFRFWPEKDISSRTGTDSDLHPVGRQYGDVDKLTRNALDALTQSGLIFDDSLVISAYAEKRFAPALDDRYPAGVSIMVQP